MLQLQNMNIKHPSKSLKTYYWNFKNKIPASETLRWINHDVNNNSVITTKACHTFGVFIPKQSHVSRHTNCSFGNKQMARWRHNFTLLFDERILHTYMNVLSDLRSMLNISNFFVFVSGVLCFHKYT